MEASLISWPLETSTPEVGFTWLRSNSDQLISRLIWNSVHFLKVLISIPSLSIVEIFFILPISACHYRVPKLQTNLTFKHVPLLIF